MRITTYILTLLLPLSLFAQVEFTAEVNKTTLTTDQRLQYSITSNTQGDLLPPSFNGFDVIFGPSVSQNMGYVYSNGSYTLSRTSTYTYILQPKEAGTFTIEPSELSTRNNTYMSESFEITVTKASNESISANSSLFLRMSLNKDEVYQGEPVVVTYYLYAKWPDIKTLRYEYPVNYPVHNGFWAQAFDEEEPNWADDVKYIDNERYRYIVFHKEVLIPLHHGELALDPFEMGVTVNLNFFGQGTPHNLKSNSTTVTVKPLPEPVPPDFTGAVGEFDMNIAVDSSAMRTGEPINITVTVEGKGNLKMVDDIILDFPSSFELFEPQTDEKIRTTISGMTGSKTYRYLVIPRNSGLQSIGPLSYSYFDPKTETYKTMYDGELVFDIAKGSGDESGSFTLLDKQDVELINEDIRHISDDTASLSRNGDRFFGSAGYYAAYLTPGLAFLILLVMRRRKKEQLKDPVGLQRKRANGIAQKRLAKAKALLADHDSAAFHEEIMRALYGYLTNKLNLPLAEISKESIGSIFEEKGVPVTLSDMFISSIERCEMARYSPVDVRSEQSLYEDAVRAIVELETQLGK